MKSVACTAANDMFRGRDGNIAFASGLEAVAQNCRTAMQAQRGEMVFRFDRGMPTRATAFDGLNAAQFEAGARAVIMAVEGVKSIDSFTVTQQGDRVIYDAAITTIYGATAVSNGI